MNGGLGSRAASRSATLESAARSRPEPAARAPTRPPAAAVLPPAALAQAPTTRERMQASFGAAEPALVLVPPVGERVGLEAPPGAPAPELALVPPAPERPTTRDRIVNRALARREAPPPPAAAAPARGIVVDLAAARERRAQPRADAAAAPPGQPAPVIALRPTPELARPPPAPEGEAAPEGAPAPAAAAPERPEAAPTPAAPAPAAEAPAAVPAAPAPAAAEAPTAKPGLPPGPAAAAAPQAAVPAAPAAAPPVIPEIPRRPEDDPDFQTMHARTRRNATRAKRHQPARAGAENAQAASQPDKEKDVASQAADEHVEVLGEQEPGAFDAARFKQDVKARINEIAPPATLSEADEFKKSGRAAEATTALHEIVSGGKSVSEHDIKTTNEAPPTAEGKVPKQAEPMVEDRTGPPLPGVGAAAAVPKPAPPGWVDLSAAPQDLDATMAEASITREQLADANEPDFTAAVEAQDAVRQHSETAPADYRANEEAVLAQGRVEAEGIAAPQLEAMRGTRAVTLERVGAVKGDTKANDAQLHDDVHQSILAIHDRTRQDVQTLLGTLDSTVDSIFTSGEQAARQHFEDYVAEEMRKYKDDRYSGKLGWARWLKDRFADLPGEVNRFYERGRADYLEAMDLVIERVAAVVGTLLGASQQRIQTGREQVRTLIESLPKSRRQQAEETAADLDHRFDELASEVDAKRDEVVDAIARKYVDARGDLDSRIEQLQEENKGLYSKAKDATLGAARAIRDLTKLLVRVLLKAASVVGDIVLHPIRFLENLIDAIKGGFERFVGRLPAHLEESLVDLLFGELGNAGITMPPQLDFAGIVDLVLQVLGLSYASIRERVAARFGEPLVARLEQAVDVFTTLVRDGVGGLWRWIREKMGDLEDLVLGKIKAFIEERVVRAGIEYVLALLTPASAFIKACQTIYRIVTFVVEKAKQIAEFIDAVLDSIAAIAQGNVGAAVEKIDTALGGALRFAIGFLARLAGLGSLSEQVRSIIALVRRPITRVVDTIVFGAAEVFRRTLGPAVAFGTAKLAAGREWAKGKIEAGRAFVQKKAQAAKVRLTGRDLAAEPMAEPEAKPRADEHPPQPIRLAEDRIDVAPDEHHTVFAELEPTGQVVVAVSTTPQLVTALVDHFEERIDLLPVTPPNPLPKGGRPGDQPRLQANLAVEGIGRGVRKVERAFELDYQRWEAEQQNDASKRHIVAPYAPPADLTSRLASLVGNSVETLLRMFYAYEKPRFARVEDEPASGQKVTGRVWVWPIVTPAGQEEILPEGGTLGLDPSRASTPRYHIVAPDPHLETPERGTRPPTRGIVHRYATAWESGRREVTVRTWAKGGTPAKGSNASHTETHFRHWFVAQGSDFHQRVAAIELRSTFSACGGCTAFLEEISRCVARRPAGAPKAQLIFFWDKLYADEKGDINPAASTKQHHIDELIEAGWLLHGPRP